MLSRNHQTSSSSTTPSTDPYSFGPKSRLKGFHKSHNIKSYCQSNNKQSSHQILLSDDDSKRIASLDNQYSALGNCEREVNQVQQQLLSSSFGTSFLLSNDFLESVDGSVPSMYRDPRIPIERNNSNISGDDSGSYLFHKACKEGPLRTVIKMLELNEKLLNARYDNLTPLYVSVQENRYEVFSELLKRNAKIESGFFSLDNMGYTKISCLYLAINVGNYKIVNDLLSQINEKNINSGKEAKNTTYEYHESPLFLAVRLGDLKMLQTLLSHTRFWPHFNLVECMVAISYSTKTVNTVFQALFTIEGKTFWEKEKKSRDCFLEIKKLYDTVGVPIQTIQSISSKVDPPSLLHFSKCSYDNGLLKTIHSPLYLAIMNENDSLTRELVKCVPNKSFGELVTTETESCLYLAIYKRSIHVILTLLRVDADEMEDVEKLREFARAEGIDLDHCIKIAKHSTNQFKKLASGIVTYYSDLEIVATCNDY